MKIDLTKDIFPLILIGKAAEDFKALFPIKSKIRFATFLLNDMVSKQEAYKFYQTIKSDDEVIGYLEKYPEVLSKFKEFLSLNVLFYSMTDDEGKGSRGRDVVAQFVSQFDGFSSPNNIVVMENLVGLQASDGLLKFLEETKIKVVMLYPVEDSTLKDTILSRAKKVVKYYGKINCQFKSPKVLLEKDKFTDLDVRDISPDYLWYSTLFSNAPYLKSYMKDLFLGDNDGK